jgi:hypothetical protein
MGEIDVARTWLIAALLALGSSNAQAAHCPHGKIYRVSMGVCVGERSKLAREIRPQRPQRTVSDMVYVDVLIPADPADPIPGMFPAPWVSGKR